MFFLLAALNGAVAAWLYVLFMSTGNLAVLAVAAFNATVASFVILGRFRSNRS